MNSDKHNQLYMEGTDLVWRNAILGDRESEQLPFNPDELSKGMDLLKEVLEINPKNWSASWVLGKGFQRLRDYEKAYSYFKDADIWHERRCRVPCPKHLGLLIELAKTCLDLGKGEEGLEVSRRAVRVEPNNPMLIGNHAVALAFTGNNDKAVSAINYALQIKPDDHMNKQIKIFVDRVSDGSYRLPKTLVEVEADKSLKEIQL
jgi:tetratricopeptide (TPR) repeat protein